MVVVPCCVVAELTQLAPRLRRGVACHAHAMADEWDDDDGEDDGWGTGTNEQYERLEKIGEGTYGCVGRLAGGAGRVGRVTACVRACCGCGR